MIRKVGTHENVIKNHKLIQIIITYLIFIYIKVIRQFGCFTENLLSRKTTRWTTQTYIMSREAICCLPVYNRSRTPDNRMCVENPDFHSVRFVFLIPQIIVLSSTKQNIQVIKILKSCRCNKTVITFIWGERQGCVL
jgi:hypothetical protein